MAEVEQFVDEVAEEEEEDPVDPQDELKEKCAELSKCAKLKEVLDECNERIEGSESTTRTCSVELHEFVHCVDHCVSKNLFKHLK